VADYTVKDILIRIQERRFTTVVSVNSQALFQPVVVMVVKAI
jgi:hypothetical protein